jgi:hypothetical protein
VRIFIDGPSTTAATDVRGLEHEEEKRRRFEDWGGGYGRQPIRPSPLLLFV